MLLTFACTLAKVATGRYTGNGGRAQGCCGLSPHALDAL